MWRKSKDNIAQYLCAALLLCVAASASAQYQHFVDTLGADIFYEHQEGSESPIHYLNDGDSEFVALDLDKPINFYSEKYDKLFINTNGILTFNIEFPEYINQPFPLEYPSIAPFYANVDTTLAYNITSISVFESKDPYQLQKATNLVNYAYPEKAQFVADKLIVATWKNVGHFSAKNDKLNTFQVALIANEEETFVHFIYAYNGINWLQGETGALGLPDIRAQAGFVAEDGRHYYIDGSGTDSARFTFTENSNIGVPGVWLFHVGALNETGNVEVPIDQEDLNAIPQAETCADSGHKTCNFNADCHDKRDGFCCVCREGFYGNGKACLKNDYPIRVTGTLAGQINGQVIDERAKLQSYVVTADSRSYTAVNPVSVELGAQLRLVVPVFSALGWLFAKSLNGVANGYHLTGGHCVHVSKIRFETGESLTVNQTFEGLNYWDQLSVKLEFFGDVPTVSSNAKLHMADYVDEYAYVSPNELHSVHAHLIEIPEENRVINFQLDQSIYFERCVLDDEVLPTGTTVLQKASKIVLDYFERDQALRTSVLTKIGVDAESNACTDGTANCGEHTVCVPYEDTYRCDCRHGYGPQLQEDGLEVCVDIDECLLQTHACDDNAMCTNNEGGFTCICFEGYEGNGYRCLKNDTATEEHEQYIPDYIIGSNYQDECQRCSHDADCVESRCQCRAGFEGDGYVCNHICGHDQVLENGRCVPILLDEHPVQPQCNFMGECECPSGYELIEDSQTCRYTAHYTSDSKSEELIPCDVDANCHINATCEWYENEMRHACTCNQGFQGDGYNCELINTSCAYNGDICDPHAYCVYEESRCVCEDGYEGDGFHCQLAPDCRDNSSCGQNAFCIVGVCQCLAGYERDVSDLCVPAGRCGPVFCGANAICKWDAQQGVQYCDCIEGYEGDALEGCRSIPPPCNVRNNCGVHATCEPTDDPARYECQCNAGFHGDGYVCVEDKNCLNTPQMCDMNAKCLSTNNGLVCVCNQGFYGNGSLCLERQQHESGFLLVSQGVVIVRVPLNGKNVKPISVASMAIGLDKDCVEGRVYWGDISSKKIVSAKYDGTDLKTFISDDVESPEGIAIDVISRRIYWTDSVKDTIEVASLENATLRAVLINKNLVNPRGIAVDPYREKLYWSDWNRESPKIEMTDLDGTGRELLLGSDAVILPNSLVILESSGELCYADAGTKKVECIDSYSKRLRTISNDLTYPFGLTFTHNQFYWTDWTTKKLESVDTFGNRQKGIQTPFFGSHKMYGMTAIEDSCPQLNSPCQINNGGCVDARICLVNSKAPSGKSCKCTTQSKTCNVPQFGVQF
ncbi:nidogen [Bactrocera tryoni]|uniref:nidogen n=1 Tax=Bactrocera tryoni TaxID=59916 RepID=UPI001A96FBEB|nr:nidogen [Bactrocera tryoni]